MPRNRAEKPKIVWKGKPLLSYYGREERPIVGVTHSGKFKAGWTFKDIGKDESGRGHIDGGKYYEGEFSHWRTEEFSSIYQAKEWAKLSLVADFHKDKAKEELAPESPKSTLLANQPSKGDSRFFEEKDVRRIWQSGWESHEWEKYNGMGGIDVHHSEERVAIGKSVNGYHVKSEGMTDGKIHSTGWGPPTASENDAKRAAKHKLADTLEPHDPGVYGLTVDPFGIPAHEAKTIGYEKAERAFNAFQRITYEQREIAQTPPPLATNAQNGNREMAQTKKLLGEIGTVKAKPPEKPSKSRVSPDR